MANPDEAPDLIDELSDAMADYIGEHSLFRALMYAMDEMDIGLCRGTWLQYAPAQGIEAATAAETVKHGSVHECPVGEADAPERHRPNGGK